MLENDFTGFDSATGDGLLTLDLLGVFTSLSSGLGLLENDFTDFVSGDSLLENDFTGFDSAIGSGLLTFTSLGIGGDSILGEGNVSFTNSSSSSSSSCSSSITGAVDFGALFATCLGISSKLTRMIVVDSFGLARIISLISSSEPSLFSNINLTLNITSSTSKLNIQFSASSLNESNHASS